MLAWLAWFGVPRLLLTFVSVVVVAGAGFWLVRAPAPPAEATLPHAGVTSVPTSSLPIVEPRPPASPPPTITSTTLPGPIVVHVAGHVRTPGIYRLDVDRRVNDAIERAGGATTRADLDSVNLAQVLFDGQRLYVPAVGEEIDAGLAELVTPVIEPASSEPTAAEPTGPIDLNRATIEQFDALPGVGPATAQAIVDERERNGPFVTVDELERVPGIGPAKLAAIRDLVVV